MKKVVILYPAHWEQAMGGSELQIFYLAKTLISQHFEVHFIYEDKGSKINNELEVKLHPLKKIKIKKRLGQRWFLYKRRIFSLLKNISPDVIYTRMYSSWSGFAADYARTNGIKHIFAIASDNDVTSLLKRTSLLRPFDIIENIYMNKAFKYATYILTQNNYQQQLLYQNYKRKGIIINQMSQSVDEQEIKKNKGVLQIVWIGNLKQIKRPDLFIKLARLFEKKTNVKFTMIGRPSEKYKELISGTDKLSNFQYLGELEQSEVNKVLLKAHVLINTSVREGFSNTFVQAWMRKVVVLSMNSNPSEIITREQIGFVCITIEEIKDKIELLLADTELRETMSERAYNYAIKNHSLEKNMNKVIKLIK